MPTYTVNLAVKVSTDGPIDGEAFTTALRNHYLEAGYDGRSPLPTENLYYWLNKMVKASVRAIAGGGKLHPVDTTRGDRRCERRTRSANTDG